MEACDEVHSTHNILGASDSSHEPSLDMWEDSVPCTNKKQEEYLSLIAYDLITY
jgi:hypothetical protein